MQGGAWFCLATAPWGHPWGHELSSPQYLPHLKRSCLTYLSPPQLKDSSTLLCSKRGTCPTRVQLDLQLRLRRGRRGTLPPSGLDTSTPAAWPESLGPSRGTGTKQLLFCQTPLDKCSTFNNKLCKPNAKQFLASKLDFL